MKSFYNGLTNLIRADVQTNRAVLIRVIYTAECIRDGIFNTDAVFRLAKSLCDATKGSKNDETSTYGFSLVVVLK